MEMTNVIHCGENQFDNLGIMIVWSNQEEDPMSREYGYYSMPDDNPEYVKVYLVNLNGNEPVIREIVIPADLKRFYKDVRGRRDRIAVWTALKALETNYRRKHDKLLNQAGRKFYRPGYSG